MKHILNMLYENKEFPEYYSFKQRDLLDPASICKEMDKKFQKKKDKEIWLESLYYNNPILQELYKYFYVFKRNIFDSMKHRQYSEIERLDERMDLQIINNYFDLDELLDEVIKAYPFMNRDELLEIRWSNKPVRQWFGLCRRYVNDKGEKSYDILINCLLSSPEVDREVIKYLIYHEMLHKSGYWNHDDNFREEEWKYPNCEEYDGFLNELTIRYNMDLILEKGEEIKTNEYIKSSEDSLNIEEGIEPKSNSKDVQDFKFCRNCGNKLPSTANFCDKCGDRINY